MTRLLDDGSFAGRIPPLPRCKWCDRLTENVCRKCDECLREIETDRRIDERRGK